VARERLDFGKRGEERAAGWLEESGYKILAKNYRTRSGEIDIVAREGDVICFIEVKTRRSEKFGLPYEAISLFKRRQISKLAVAFLKENNLLEHRARFDTISIISNGKQFQLDLARDAFGLEGGFIY